MKKIIAISIIYLLVVFLLGYFVWSNQRVFFDYSLPIDFEGFGTIGDFIGGILGTLFAALAVYYAWLTFEKGTIKNHFYEMLKQHKDNVNAISIVGVDVFEKYIKLIDTIYKSVLSKLNENEETDTYKPFFKLAYLYFFYGAPLDPQIISSPLNIERKKIETLNQHFSINNIILKGHSVELGIYFRQLYQIVTYINEQKALSYKEKYEYVKSLRVCLNLNEQYLFFLNSMSTLGNVWELSQGANNHDKRLITKYNLLKNLPKSYNEEFLRFNFKRVYPNVYYEYMPEEKRKLRKMWEDKYS